jgi:hypothetical protein
VRTVAPSAHVTLTMTRCGPGLAYRLPDYYAYDVSGSLDVPVGVGATLTVINDDSVFVALHAGIGVGVREKGVRRQPPDLDRFVAALLALALDTLDAEREQREAA